MAWREPFLQSRLPASVEFLLSLSIKLVCVLTHPNLITKSVSMCEALLMPLDASITERKEGEWRAKPTAFPHEDRLPPHLKPGLRWGWGRREGAYPIDV
jgi:hypothetical protein